VCRTSAQGIDRLPANPLARLVFDRGDDGAGFVDQVDALHAVDWGQLPKVVPKLVPAAIIVGIPA
jgi:hypothetical protein